MEGVIDDYIKYTNESVSHTPIIDIQKNVDTKVLCQSITQTSANCNVVSVMGGKYIIIKNNNIQAEPFYTEIETYTEVNSMNPKLNKKINYIYDGIIAGSLILIMITMINIKFTILNISIEYLIAIIICSFIGCVSFIYDKLNFNRELYHE